VTITPSMRKLLWHCLLPPEGGSHPRRLSFPRECEREGAAFGFREPEHACGVAPRAPRRSRSDKPLGNRGSPLTGQVGVTAHRIATGPG